MCLSFDCNLILFESIDQEDDGKFLPIPSDVWSANDGELTAMDEAVKAKPTRRQRVEKKCRQNFEYLVNY